MPHEKGATFSNKAGTVWWNESTVGKDKGKKLGTTFKTKAAAVAASKRRSKNPVRDPDSKKKRGPK
jgi:hypothetical protein